MAPNTDSVSDFKRCSQIKFKIFEKEFTVNVNDVTPETTLNTYIRNVLNMKGTKHMCLEGGCGACIVAVRIKDASTGKDIVFAINSCLVAVLSCHGWNIETIDGIGGPLTSYHPVQQVLADYNGTQCGYCSPGMVMNMYSLYENATAGSGPQLTPAQIEDSFGGNICRCTGYRPILEAFKSLINKEECADIEDIGQSCSGDGVICDQQCLSPCKKRTAPYCHYLANTQWIKVYTLADLLSSLKKIGDSTYMLVCGNTGKGVYRLASEPQVYIDIREVAELIGYELNQTQLVLGANVSMTFAMDLFNKLSTQNVGFSYLKKLADHIDLIANVPIRNIGSLAGNLMMKHDHNEFPSDIFLILETAGAVATIVDIDGVESTSSLKDFVTSDMKKKVLKNITLPALDDTYKYESYKIMPRAQNAHAMVNAGFLFKFSTDNSTIDAATVVYGCIGPTFVHATNTEQYLLGKTLWDDSVLQQSYLNLTSELRPDYVPPDTQPEFRKQLAIALFYKTVLSLAPSDKISPKNQSGGTKMVRPVSSGTQSYETDKSLYPLTEPIPKIEALAQTSGQAQYIDDIPDIPGQLHAIFVLCNTTPSSKITKIDASKALAQNGIVAVFTHTDIPGDNNFMPSEIGFSIVEEILCSGTVRFHGQPVALIVGTSVEAVYQARNLVEVDYTQPTAKPLVTIKEILDAGATDKVKHQGTIEPKSKGDNIKHVVKGYTNLGPQYHFHMETQVCRAVPTEDGIDLYPSSQWMDLIQTAVANCLKIPLNKINIKVRRCGGAFGAKISRNTLIACATALASWKLRKPVAMYVHMEDNMRVVGMRFPLYSEYEVGVDDAGVVQYLYSSLYSDFGQGGNEDAFPSILDLFTRNYDKDTYRINYYTTTTDTAANTWARAPGTTEGLAAIEAIMEHIGYEIGVDPVDVRVANITQEKVLPGYITDIKEWANIEDRKKDIATFNQANRWKKKGLSVVPMAYGFDIFGPFMAAVSIYHSDGTVAVEHSGIEVGQGINTKAAQVCAYELGIPLESVSIKPSNNFTGANTTTTGGSITSEAVCYGVIQACTELKQRLEPYKKSTWLETVQAAFQDYVKLTAFGQYSPKEPGVSPYVIYGACAAEVELDVLTGQHLVTRVDLLEDTGSSMSPVIDIGQVEGAFVMGAGYQTSEQMVFSAEGQVLTNRTWNYKPPGAKDIPIDFRVKFPAKNPNPLGVLHSKATAEPPLCMTIVIPLAIRNAIASARADADPTQPKWYLIDGPSTVDNTFMNSLNNYNQYVL